MFKGETEKKILIPPHELKRISVYTKLKNMLIFFNDLRTFDNYFNTTFRYNIYDIRSSNYLFPRHSSSNIRNVKFYFILR